MQKMEKRELKLKNGESRINSVKEKVRETVEWARMQFIITNPPRFFPKNATANLLPKPHRLTGITPRVRGHEGLEGHRGIRRRGGCVRSLHLRP